MKKIVMYEVGDKVFKTEEEAIKQDKLNKQITLVAVVDNMVDTYLEDPLSDDGVGYNSGDVVLEVLKAIRKEYGKLTKKKKNYKNLLRVYRI